MRYLLVVAALFLVSCAKPPPSPTSEPTAVLEPTATPVPPTSTPEPTPTPEPTSTITPTATAVPTPTSTAPIAAISVSLSLYPFCEEKPQTFNFTVDLRGKVRLYAPFEATINYNQATRGYPLGYVRLELWGSDNKLILDLGVKDVDVVTLVEEGDRVMDGDPLVDIVGLGPTDWYNILFVDYQIIGCWTTPQLAEIDTARQLAEKLFG